jgi:hypothetical protein
MGRVNYIGLAAFALILLSGFMPWWTISVSILPSFDYYPFIVADIIQQLPSSVKGIMIQHLSAIADALLKARQLIPEGIQTGMMSIAVSLLFYFVSLLVMLVTPLVSSKKGQAFGGFIGLLSPLLLTYGLRRIGLGYRGNIELPLVKEVLSARWSVDIGFYMMITASIVCFIASATNDYFKKPVPKYWEKPSIYTLPKGASYIHTFAGLASQKGEIVGKIATSLRNKGIKVKASDVCDLAVASYPAKLELFLTYEDDSLRLSTRTMMYRNYKFFLFILLILAFILPPIGLALIPFIALLLFGLLRKSSINKKLSQAIRGLNVAVSLKCKFCGADMLEGTLFCPQCGKAQG